MKEKLEYSIVITGVAIFALSVVTGVTLYLLKIECYIPLATMAIGFITLLLAPIMFKRG